MKEFFKVTDLDTVLGWPSLFPRVEIETIPIETCFGRILGRDIVSDVDLQDFSSRTETPFYIYSRQEIINNCSRVQQAGEGIDLHRPAVPDCSY